MILKAVLGLAVVLAALVAGGLLGNRPPLLAEPGPATRLKTYLTRNVAATDPASPFPELRPRRYDAPPARLLELAAAACVDLGWTLRERADGALRAEVTTPILRFTDDVTVRAPPAPGGGSELYVESRSRVGRADLGANLRHVMDLHAALDRRVVPRGEAGR